MVLPANRLDHFLRRNKSNIDRISTFCIFNLNKESRELAGNSHLPSVPVRRSDSPLFFTPGRSDDGLVPTPYFSTHLSSSPSLRHSGQTLGRASEGFFCARLLFGACDTWGASPFLFSSRLVHLLLTYIQSSLLFFFLFPSSRPLSALASRVPSLSSSSPSTCCPVTVPCPFLADIACHYVSLCRSISPLPLRPFPSRCIRLCLQCVPGEVLCNKDTESVRSSDTGANLSICHASTLLGIGCTDISSKSYSSDSQRRIDVTCLKYSPRRWECSFEILDGGEIFNKCKFK